MKDYTTDTLQLTNLAKKMKINLVGVYSKDTMPKKTYVGGYIINLQDSDEGNGSHWTALYITKNSEILYFDSFGLPYPVEIKEFVSNKPVAINTRQIQDINSTLCGYYCLWFLKYIETNKNNKTKSIFEIYDNFLNIFRFDTIQNGDIVKKYFGI